MCNSSCHSINLVYIIYCNLCYNYYIGQTKNLKKRLDKHKRNIIKNLNDEKTTKLIKHFNQSNHSIDNFKFFIFKNNLIELNIRLNQENQLIHLFLKLDIPILNEKIPKIDCHRNHSSLFDC